MEILAQTLNITWVGIALVFVGILALWGMMVLLVYVFRDRKPKETTTGSPALHTTTDPDELRKKAALAAVSVALSGIEVSSKAAAAAVAVVLALGNGSNVLPAAVSQHVNSWQIANRIVQLNLRNQTFTRKPRGK